MQKAGAGNKGTRERGNKGLVPAFSFLFSACWSCCAGRVFGVSFSRQERQGEVFGGSGAAARGFFEGGVTAVGRVIGLFAAEEGQEAPAVLTSDGNGATSNIE
jgi:hypothetical protein